MERIATATFTRMAKRLLVLMAVTGGDARGGGPGVRPDAGLGYGVLLAASGGPGNQRYPLDHGRSIGTVYALESEVVDLDAYVGQK